MKARIREIKKTIRSNRGETLMEGVVSLLALSILLLAATAMIQTALRMTSISTQNAQETQEYVNLVAVSEYNDSGFARITFSSDGFGILAAHDIILNKDDDMTAFIPEDE